MTSSAQTCSADTAALIRREIAARQPNH